MERAFRAYNEGRVDAETYDAMVENADIFSEDDEDEEDDEEW